MDCCVKYLYVFLRILSASIASCLGCHRKITTNGGIKIDIAKSVARKTR